MSTAKKIDPKGRLTLGPRYAGSEFFIEEKTDGTIVLSPAITIPTKEAWLFQNPQALFQVKTGLQQAAHGEKAPDPQANDSEKDWVNEIDNSSDDF